jgi:tetratricopeptide (TPR) repeat protein
MSKKPSISPERARERALFLYSSALQRGDFDAVAAVLKLAERDAILDQMIKDLDSLDIVPEARQEAHILPPRNDKYIQQVVTVSNLAPNGHSPEFDHHKEGEDSIYITYDSTRSIERQRFNLRILTMAAAILMLALLGGILIQMGNNPKIGYPAAVSLETEEPTAEPTPACETSTDYIAQGEANIISGDYAAALTAYNCAIEVDPSKSDAYLLRGGLAAANQDYDQLAYDLYSFGSHQVAGTDIAEMSITKMLRPLGDAIVARPDDPVLYMLRGLISFDLGIFIRDFDRLIELDPDNPVGYLYGWKATGERVYTADDFQKVIELAPDSMLIPAGMNAALFAENAEFALPYFDRAIQVNPEHPFAYEQRGIANILLGDMAAAASDFYQHIQNHHTDVIEEEPLTLGESLIFDAVSGAVYRFPFTAQAGQKLDIVVGRENTELIGGQYPPTVVILDPQSNLVSAPYVMEDWPGPGATSLTAIRDFEIPESGDYTIITTANSTGSLRIETVETNN